MKESGLSKNVCRAPPHVIIFWAAAFFFPLAFFTILLFCRTRINLMQKPLEIWSWNLVCPFSTCVRNYSELFRSVALILTMHGTSARDVFWKMFKFGIFSARDWPSFEKYSRYDVHIWYGDSSIKWAKKAYFISHVVLQALFLKIQKFKKWPES